MSTISVLLVFIATRIEVIYFLVLEPKTGSQNWSSYVFPSQALRMRAYLLFSYMVFSFAYLVFSFNWGDLQNKEKTQSDGNDM